MVADDWVESAQMVQVVVVAITRVALQPTVTVLQTAMRTKISTNFFIICIFWIINDLFLVGSVASGIPVDDLQPDVLALFLFVEQTLDHGLVLGFAVEEDTALRVFGFDTAVHPDAGPSGYVPHQWQELAEARAHRHRDGIDHRRDHLVCVLQRACRLDEQRLSQLTRLAHI